jgi:hypothetical protein
VLQKQNTSIKKTILLEEEPFGNKVLNTHFRVQINPENSVLKIMKFIESEYRTEYQFVTKAPLSKFLFLKLCPIYIGCPGRTV